MKFVEDKAPIVLVVLSGLLFVPLVFIGGLVWGLNLGGNGKLAADTLSAWVGAIATVAIAILTFILARETWYLRLAQIRQIDELKIEAMRPSLEFYILSAQASIHMMNAHIQNNGKGIARNVSFKFYGSSGDVLSSQERAVVEKFQSLNMLKNGLTSLGASKERKSFVFSFLDLINKNGDALFGVKIRASIEFEDAEGRKYASESIVDFSEFKGVSEVGGGDPLYNLYKETEKIVKVLESVQAGMSSKRLNINVYSSADREEEQKALEDRLRELREKKENS
ncbi:COG1361 family protein [Pollutimonas thiosulfatoxidans]|uniref:Uncharacterized protein n=1 Tax=Pollutimonas thiosulfatoxidans TaxID=2028345 RepID=A0A410GDL7_9BURK|nr:hypothetical protein [Pollutimonas thiosulfatoxidans]QAA94392.1 hypothetical protein CKA81_11525 [Pollutimonas thiosulfatoxidans]